MKVGLTKMSHKQNQDFIETFNDARDEENLPHITLSQAIEELFDPYREIVRESVENITQMQNDRMVEYGD